MGCQTWRPGQAIADSALRKRLRAMTEVQLAVKIVDSVACIPVAALAGPVDADVEHRDSKSRLRLSESWKTSTEQQRCGPKGQPTASA